MFHFCYKYVCHNSNFYLGNSHLYLSKTLLRENPQFETVKTCHGAITNKIFYFLLLEIFFFFSEKELIAIINFINIPHFYSQYSVSFKFIF